MSELDNIPQWAQETIKAVGEAAELSAPTGLEWRYSPAHENGWGMDLVEVAPAVEELASIGPDDGAEVYGLFHSLDILRIQRTVFDVVEDVTFGFETNSDDKMKYGWFTLEGKADNREFILRIKTEPFEEDDV